MKQALLTLLTFSLVFAKAEAQITLNADWLLDVGFEITLLGDDRFSDPTDNLSKTGANQTWTFSNLGLTDSSFVEAIATSEATYGSNFPNADLVLVTETTTQVPGQNTKNEIYMQKNGDDLLIVALADVSTGGALPPIGLTDPLTFQSTPIFFGASGNDESRVRATFGPELLVAITGDSSSLALVDSVALSLVQNIDYEVDSWGTLNLPGNSYDALRLRSTNTTTQEFEVLTTFGFWVPITDLIPNPGDLGGLGNFQVTDYSWLVEEYAYPVVQVTVDSSGNADRIQYAGDAVSSTQAPVAFQGFEVIQHGDMLSVAIDTEVDGAGDLRIFGSDGRQLYAGQIDLSNAPTQVNTAAMANGVHLVTVWRQGRIIATKRVSVMH